MNIFKPKSKKQESLSLGARGEEAAKNYLKKNGYKIIATNFYNPSGRRLGEIDIIAKIKDEYVFVEVKTRKLNIYCQNLPEENITASKLYKINKVASFYLRQHNLSNYPYRFDAISLVFDPLKNTTNLRHLKNIFL